MKKLIALVLVFFTVGCQSLPLKKTIVLSAQNIEVAAGSAQDFENTAYKSQLWKISPETHKEINAKLARVFNAQIKLAIVLKTWKAGDPYPEELNEVITATSEAVDLINRLGLKDPQTQAQAQQMITMLNAILKSVAIFSQILGGAK